MFCLLQVGLKSHPAMSEFRLELGGAMFLHRRCAPFNCLSHCSCSVQGGTCGASTPCIQYTAGVAITICHECGSIYKAGLFIGHVCDNCHRTHLVWLSICHECGNCHNTQGWAIHRSCEWQLSQITPGVANYLS